MTTRNPSELVDLLTLEEQVSLLSGADFWSVDGIPRLGIGRLRVSDGPNGVRGGGAFIGGIRSASFPVGIALGSTWDTQLLQQIGAALAEEARSKCAHVLLAPTINLQRSVTNGRNFECYSEDPVLTAALAVAYVRGLQNAGIAATPKHFVGNESEFQRHTISSEIDEKTLRELYLLPFEAVVRQAGPWAVMSSYNRLNGCYTSEHEWLLNEVLRRQWGFDGVVMSDWFGSHSTAATVNAGLDLEMPGPTRDRGEKLIQAVEDGEVDAKTVRARALNMLTLMQRTGALYDQSEAMERADDRPEHRALIRKAGVAACVLLRNNGILPLDREEIRNVATIGPNARTAQIMGGGSAQINAHYRVDPHEGLQDSIAGNGQLLHAPGCTNHRYEPLLRVPFDVEYFASEDLTGPVRHTDRIDEVDCFWIGEVAEGKVDHKHFSVRMTGEYVPSETGQYRVGAIVAGYGKVYVNDVLVADAWSNWQRGTTLFSEGCDEVIGLVDLEAGRPARIVVEFATKPVFDLDLSAIRVGIGLPLGDEAIREAVAAAAQCETAIVYVGRSAEWDSEGSDLPDMSLPGRQNELIEAVARENPNTVVVLQTGGPVEMPWIDQVAAVLQAWYPGQEAGNAISDVLFGDAEPGGRLPQSFPVRWSDNATHSDDALVYPGRDGRVNYAEGRLIGYRHHDRHGIPPLFPFGYGLAYTSFVLSNLSIEDVDKLAAGSGRVRVSVDVSNTGERQGSTVVQLYVADTLDRVDQPVRQLQGFTRVSLHAGQSTRITIELTDRAFASYDLKTASWQVECGEYWLHVGFSSVDLPLSGSLSLSQRVASGLPLGMV